MGDARTLSAPIDDLKQRVDRIRWWHTIDLGGVVITPGASDNLKTLPKLGLPERLDGKAVLDIGAWDGFFSFEAERRGACLGDRLVCVADGRSGSQGGFRIGPGGPSLEGGRSHD